MFTNGAYTEPVDYTSHSIIAFMPCSPNGSLTFSNENLYIFYLSCV